MAPPPLRCLPRSISARADPPSPFISNPTHQPAAAAASSFGCLTPTATDSPPDTPKGAVKHKSAPAFVTFLSPRKLMQRAFRSSRSRRRRKFDARDELALSPVTTSRLSDAASAGSMDVDHGRSSDGNNNGAAVDMVQDEMTNHQPPPVVKENNAADGPNKAGAVPAPEEPVDVADKSCIVVKEVMIKKHEEEGCDDTTKEATRVFQGSRVKTAMVARAESEHPRRREVARSNDRIEEACTKLLAKRQGSRVRALVGAFETVGKPRHHCSNSI
jgi:hypothetical protein